MLWRAGRLVIQEQRSSAGGSLVRFSRAAVSSVLARPYAQSAAAQAVDPATFQDKEEKASVAIKPRSLGLDENSSLRVVDPPPQGFSGMALKLLGFYSRESQLIRGTRTLYSRISSHAERPELYSSFLLEKSFRTTHAMLLLHMWLILVRLRPEGKDGAKVGQSLYELFNHDLEQRIVAAGVKMLISKWMKELEKNFYGAVAAYDAAMQSNASQDDLPRALWRNVYAEDDSLMPSGVTAAPVKSLARYVRREAACLALTDRENLLSGNMEFSSSFSANSVKDRQQNPLGKAPISPLPA